MNDRYNYIRFDTDSGTDVGENGTDENDGGELSTKDNDTDSGGDSVSDAVGSDSDSDTDTESDAENIESDAVADTESGVESSENDASDYAQSGEVDYLSELEYIDYLLNTQIENQEAVLSVSGNSVNVSLDDESMQLLTEIRDGQLVMHGKCDVLINLMSCLLLAVVVEYLIMSSKRVMKKMVNRKDM